MSILKSKMKPMEGFTAKGGRKENYEDPD